MTKKEKAVYEAALLEAETLAALRWTAPVEPDVQPPSRFDDVTEGWTANLYTKSVNRGWSKAGSHGDGIPGRHGSQRPEWLYSTQKRALEALRHMVELEAAKDLLAIDKRIKALKEAAA